ncbi:MAG: arylesterase [Methyloligellaceae bacterium]
MNLFPIWRLNDGGASILDRLGMRPFARAVLIFLALSLTTGGALAERETVIVAFGDSLTAGYRLPPDQSFPAQLQVALRKRGHKVRVVNSGVSGDTAAAGLARLEWAMPQEAQAVILELGANDALRGLDPNKTLAALDRIIATLKQKGLSVLLAGMQAPRNLGPEYTKAFGAIYPTLTRKHGVLLYPFFLDGVAGLAKLNQNDGIHPTGKGIAVIVERILPSVEKLIERTASKRKPQG